MSSIEAVLSRIRNALLIILLLLILAWTAWPVVLVSAAGAIASANGCQLDEGSAHPCIVNGSDVGEQIYGMGVMGWFMLVTVPTGLIALAAYGAILLGVWLVKRARRRGRRPAPT
jgi:hypothetical protein